MKKFAAIIVALALLPAISFAADTNGSAAVNKSTGTPVSTTGGNVSELSGDVFIARGTTAAHQAVKNEAVTSGTTISTGAQSYAVLKFEDGQIVTMQADSTFLVREYRYEPERKETGNIVFSMLKGGLRFVTGLIGQNNKKAFRLSTPNATIGIRGTEFMVAMANNSMYSQVLSGNIGMTNAAGMVTLGAGQTAYVASASALASLIPASAVPAGTFSQLLSIPVTTAPATTSASPATAAASVAAGGAATSAGIAGGAGIAAGAGIASGAGVVGGALLGIVSGDSASSSSEQAPPAADASATTEAVTKEEEKTTSENDKAGEKEENKAEAADKSRSGVGVTGKIGTLGYGAELNFGSSDSFSARIGLNAFNYKYNANSSSVNYDFKLQLQTVSALADWYPFEGGLRTSVGLLYNNNKATLNAVPGAGGYTINGVTYTSAAVSSLQGTMSFNKVAPYLGIGWGNPVAKGKGWGMTSDFGVLLQGSPKTNLIATCGASLTPTQCNTLQTNVAAENAKLQNDLSNFKFWPVISVGISYQW